MFDIHAKCQGLSDHMKGYGLQLYNERANQVMYGSPIS